MECTPEGGQVARLELTGNAGLLKDGSHGCQSARKFDPPETRDINELARRSAPNIHAEQHTAISPKRMRRVRPSSLQQKCPYDKNDDPSNQPNDIDCCGDAVSTIREHRR